MLWFYYSTQDLDSQILNRIEYNNLKIDKNAKRNFNSYALNYEKKTHNVLCLISNWSIKMRSIFHIFFTSNFEINLILMDKIKILSNLCFTAFDMHIAWKCPTVHNYMRWYTTTVRVIAPSPLPDQVVRVYVIAICPAQMTWLNICNTGKRDEWNPEMSNKPSDFILNKL